MEDIAELVFMKQSSHQLAEIDGSLGQGVIGEHRAVKVPRQLAGDPQRTEVSG
jgi:hypothetical protein